MNGSRQESLRHWIRRCVALLGVAALMPYAFQRMDEVYFVSAQLKRMVSVFGIETVITSQHRRVRFGMVSQMAESSEANVTILWKDEDGAEVGRGTRRVSLFPGDTTYVSLASRSQETRTAVSCSVAYELK